MHGRQFSGNIIGNCTLTTAAPNIITNSNEPAPITITAIAHCGINEFCSVLCIVGAIRCFGITIVEIKCKKNCYYESNSRFHRSNAIVPIKSVEIGSSKNLPIK